MVIISLAEPSLVVINVLLPSLCHGSMGFKAPYRQHPRTLAEARWLGSSLDLSAPTPMVGSWVWKTDTRPPVGDSSLKAACSAGPRADWVSMVFSNMWGRLLSRSCTSWEHTWGVWCIGHVSMMRKGFLMDVNVGVAANTSTHSLTTGGVWGMFSRSHFKCSVTVYISKMLLTSLHSLRFTRRLSGVGKNISKGKRRVMFPLCVYIRCLNNYHVTLMNELCKSQINNIPQMSILT